MLTPRKEEVIHKAWLMRLLTAIADHPTLNKSLGFKGGTCAALRGFLNRFSVDLDFDVLGDARAVNKGLLSVFKQLGLTVKDHSKKVPQYFVQYPTQNIQNRHTIKIDALLPPPQANRYEKARLPELDRIMQCQTRSTMVANKMVALMERHERTGHIAGRDLFDIHHFFFHGYEYDPLVIQELRNKSVPAFLNDLIQFIEINITGTIIDQDLNVLLPDDVFHRIRKTLKQETLQLLKDELRRIG